MGLLITVHNIGLNPLPQVKLGKTLNLPIFGVFLKKIKVDPESWCNKLSIKQLRKKKIPKDDFI